MKKIPEKWRLVIVYTLAALMAPASIAGYFAWYMLVPCTQYSERYSEDAFRAVRIGDALPDVIDKLGPPYRVVPPYLEKWNYAWGSVFLNDNGTAELNQLYDWDRETILKNMGQLPSTISGDLISGMSRDDLIKTLGNPQNIQESPWPNERLHFYTHAASGGMWSDRTWKKRVLYVDIRTQRVIDKISTWMLIGDPVD